MAKTLQTDANFRLIWDYQNQPDSGLGSGTDAPKIVDGNTMVLSDEMTDGSGAEDVANLLWHDVRSLAGSSSEEFDLYGGLTDSFGTTLNFATIRAFCISNRNASSDTDGILEIGGSASNAWATWLGNVSDTIKVGPGGGMFLWCPSAAGYAVTNSTADKLKVTNTGTEAIEYQIALIGD